MVDRTDGKDGPERNPYRGLKVVPGGAGVDSRDDTREGRDGLGRDDRRDGPGRDAAGRDRRAEERDGVRGAAGGRGRDAGADGPMQPDTLDEQERRDRRLDVAVDSDPAAERDERDAALSNAAALRAEAAGFRAEADRHETGAEYHDRWMYDADAAAGQATDPADRSLAIRDKNEHRAASVDNDAESEHDDRLADAAVEAADRQVASAPAAPPRPGEERRVADTRNAQQHSGVQVAKNPPLTDAAEAPRVGRTTEGRRGSRRAPQAPGKERPGHERPRR